ARAGAAASAGAASLRAVVAAACRGRARWALAARAGAARTAGRPGATVGGAAYPCRVRRRPRPPGAAQPRAGWADTGERAAGQPLHGTGPSPRAAGRDGAPSEGALRRVAGGAGGGGGAVAPSPGAPLRPAGVRPVTPARPGKGRE